MMVMPLLRKKSGRIGVTPLSLSVTTLKHRSFIIFICSIVLTLGTFTEVFAMPQGGSIAAGGAVITTPAPNAMQINQSTSKAVINWQSYNISANERVHYQQPDSSSIALNRINPAQGASQIYGRLTANGQVWLINPAGIYFGPSAYVSVAGLLATTANISNQDFMAGRYRFVQQPGWNGAVVNDGYIKTAEAGLVALVGPGVVNNGYIEANLGTVVLAAGNEFTVNFSGNDLIGFTVDKERIAPAYDRFGRPLKNGVSNAGKIIANGGKIIMTARTASEVLDHSINMTGVAQANSVRMKKGEIIFLADQGSINISGKVIVSGKRPGQQGGVIKIRASKVAITDRAKLDVSGHRGGGSILIGGRDAGTDYIYAGPQTIFNADAIAAGNGGSIILFADKGTQAGGQFSAKGGSEGGNGGFIETSAEYLNVAGIVVDLSAAIGRFGDWLLDPTSVNITNGVTSGITLSLGVYTPTIVGAAAAVLNAGDLGTALSLANIQVVTTNPSGTGPGDITFNDPLNQLQTNWGTVNTTLTLSADRNITMTSNLTLNGTNQVLNLNAGQTVATGSISLNGTMNGAFSLNATSGASGSITIAGAIGGVSALNSVTFNSATTIGANVTTSGAQTYNNPVTLSGSRTVNGGTITMPAVTLGTATLTVNTSSATSAINGLISGVGGDLTKAGTGTLTLNAANTYTGTTTINAGTLKLGIANGIGSSSAVTLANVAGALFDLNDFSDTIGSLAGGGAAGGNVSLGSATLTTSNNTSTTFTGVMSGTGGLTKGGTGVMTLAGSNIFTGATLVNAGTLRLTNANALGLGATQSSDITVIGGASLNLNFATATLGNTNAITINGTGVSGAGALFASSSTETVSNAILLGSDAALGGANSMILNGIISDGGSNFSLTKVGAGTTTLSNSNTYGGGTTVSAGTLSVTNQGGLGTTGNIDVNGGTLRLALGGNTLQNAGTLTFGGGALTDVIAAGTTDTLNNPIILNSTPTITSTTTNSTLDLAGAISGTGGITKAGNGILLLSNANSYEGVTSVADGVLSVTNADGLGGAAGGAISVVGGATLTMNLGGATLANPNAISLTGTAILSNTVAGGSTDTLNNPITVISGSPTITSMNSTATLALTGGITQNGTTLTLNGAGNHAVSGVVSGAGTAITKAGAGSLILSNANLYTSATNVNAGTLSVTNADGLGGAAGGAISVASGATLTMNLGGATLANPNTLTLTGAAILTDTVAGGSTDTLNNPIILTSSTPAITSVNAAALLVLAGNITNNTANLNINGAGDTHINGVIGAGSGDLTKAGAGTLTLNAANNYTGATTINAGTLKLGIANGIGASSAVTLANVAGALFDLNSFSDTIGSLAGGGAAGGNVLLGSGSLTAGGNNTSTTFTGVMSGTGGLTKAGAGVMTLAGSNTFTGATNINAGTLRLTNASALGSGATQSSSTTVVSGASLNLNFASGTLGNTNTININGAGVGGAGALFASTSTETLSNAIVLAGNAAVGGANTMVLNGIISDGGSNFSLTKVGAGSTTLSNANTWGGGTTVSAGTLSVTNQSGLGTTGNIAVNAGTLSLALGGNTLQNASTITFGGGSLTDATAAGTTDTLNNPITLNSTPTITTSTTNGTLALAGAISGAGGMTKAGNGILRLANANSYAGVTNINNGILSVANTGGLGSSSAMNVASGGTLEMNFLAGTLLNTNNITLNGLGEGNVGALIGTGTGNILSNNIIFASATRFGGIGTLILNGIVSGAFNLTKVGAGTITLNGSNTYGGSTAVNGGTLRIGHPDGLGNSTSVSVTTGEALDLAFNSAALSNTSTITLNGTGVGGTGALTFSGSDITLNSPIVLAGNTTIGGSGSGTMILTGGISGSSNLTVTLNNAGVTLPAITLGAGNNLSVTTNGDITQTGVFTIPGTSDFNAGAGSINLALANLLTGAVTLANTGAHDATLNNAMNLTLGASSIGRKLTVTSSGTLTLSGSLSANAAGDSIVLSTTRFVNSGAFSLNPGIGRFLVWSSNADPFGGLTPDIRGGIAYNFKQYNATYGVSSVLGSGNGFLYTLAPEITPLLIGIIQKVYDGNTIANLTGHYASSGTVDGDTVTFNPATGFYATPNPGTGINVSVSGISIASATNGSATVYGYGLTTTNANTNTGVITPAVVPVPDVVVNPLFAPYQVVFSADLQSPLQDILKNSGISDDEQAFLAKYVNSRNCVVVGMSPDIVVCGGL